MRRPPSLSWAPLAALVVLVALSTASSASASPIAALRSQANTYAARAHRALLDLYSIQSQLARERANLTDVHVQAARVRSERALVERQVRITRRAYDVSRRQLASRLRALYEAGNVDTLAVLFGSRSLDNALTNIDAVHRLAAQSKSAVAQTTATGRKLRRLSLRLDAHIARLASLRRSAERATASLESARTQRVLLIGSLQTKERLSRQAVASLVTTARAAEAKSEHLAIAASPPSAPTPTGSTTTASTGSTTSPPAAPPPAPTRSGSLTVVATGYSIHGHTATGVTTGWGVAAVDPSVIPLGTRFSVPGYGTAVAADVGSGVRGAAIDLWFPTVAQARAWGRKTITITIRN